MQTFPFFAHVDDLSGVSFSAVLLGWARTLTPGIFPTMVWPRLKRGVAIGSRTRSIGFSAGRAGTAPQR